MSPYAWMVDMMVQAARCAARGFFFERKTWFRIVGLDFCTSLLERITFVINSYIVRQRFVVIVYYLDRFNAGMFNLVLPSLPIRVTRVEKS